MADQKDIKNQQDLNNEKRQTASIDKEINNEASRTKTLEEQIIELLSTRRGINSGVLSDQQDIANSLQDQVKQQQFLTSEKKLTRDISNSVTKIAQEAYSITSKELGLSKTQATLTKQQETLEKNIILAKQQQAKFSEMSQSGDVDSRRLNSEIANSLGDQAKQAREVARQIEQTRESSDAISKTGGVKAFGLMGDVADKLGMSKIAGPVQEAAEAARAHGAEQIEMNAGINKGIGDYKQFRAEGMKMGDALKKAGVSAKQVKVGKLPLKATGTLTAGFKALGPILKKAMGPLALIVEAVQAFIQIDKQSGEVAKSMGISADAARRVNAEMADAAAMSGDLLVSSKDVVAANMALNKSFGTSVAFSGELASEFASVSERTGLSEKAMAMFGKKALIAGGSIKDQLEKVTEVTMELSNQTGVMMNAKDIQEGLAEMSNAQMLTAQGNTKEMARQVFQAKMLGVSQSQLEKMGGSLLDFESSIAAEMEAELLTGKQLNLEGARAAALAGDQAKLATEIRKEVGTAKEFGAMNVIQQEAMAKAFGLSRDEMADMLVKQQKNEAVKKAGFKSMSDAQKEYDEAMANGMMTEKLKKKLSKAGVLDQMKSATAQDKMNAAMEKFTDLFVQIMDPLMPIIDALMAILEPIFAILSPIAKLIGDIVQLVVATMMPAFNAITGIFDGLASSFTSIFGGFGEVIAGIFSFDTEMILGGLKSIVNGAVKLIAMPFQFLTDFVVGALNVVIKGVNLIPGVDFALMDSPDLAGMVALAEGGVVTGPTNALVGEGSEAEAVLPLSKLADMLPSGVAIGDAVLNAATAPMRGIINTIGSIFDQGDIGDAIKNPISGLMDTVSGMFGGNNIVDTLANAVTGPMRGVMDVVGGVFGNDNMGDILKNPLEGIMDTVGGMLEGNNIGDSIISAATAPMRGIMDVASSLFGGNEQDEMSSPDMGESFLGGIGDVVGSLFSGSRPSTETSSTQQENANNAEMVTLLKSILVAVKEGGDVYIDGAKAGRSMALATSKIG